MEPRGRERHRWANPRGRSGREHMSQSGDASESMLSQFRRDPISVSRRRELLVRRMRSILTKSMKDSVVRGCLLHLLYERQREGLIPLGHAEQAVPPPGGISRHDWLRAVAQLSEYRIIDWTPLEYTS